MEAEDTARRWIRRLASLGVFLASCAGWWLLSTYGARIPTWVGIPLMLTLFGTTFGCATLGARLVPVILRPIDRANWAMTMDDLEAEAKAGRRSATITAEEMELARVYEISLLPAGTVFARSGQVWEALEDVDVTYIVYYRAPFSTGGRGILRRGEQVRIDPPTDGQMLGVGAQPLRSDEIEKSLIPESTRRDRKYDGYGLYLKTTELNRYFRLVDTPAANPLE